MVGEDLVAVALDKRYQDVGDILFVLGLQGFIIPIGFFSNLVFAGLDRSDLSLKFSIAYLCIAIPAVWIAAGHGVIWALSASLITMGVATAVATVVQVSLLGGRLEELATALAPAYLSATAMFTVVLAASRMLPIEPGLLRLACLTGSGMIAYAFWLLAFHRREAVQAWQYAFRARST